MATGAQSSRVNYPPNKWLEREGWTPPVIVDDEAGTVANAFGLHAYPFWAGVTADGRTVIRNAGPLPVESFLEFAATLALTG